TTGADTTLAEDAAADTNLIAAVDDTTAIDTASAAIEGEDQDDFDQEEFRRTNPLFAVLNPSFMQTNAGQMSLARGPVVGTAQISDTAKVNEYLRSDAVTSAL